MKVEFISDDQIMITAETKTEHVALSYWFRDNVNGCSLEVKKGTILFDFADITQKPRKGSKWYLFRLFKRTFEIIIY